MPESRWVRHWPRMLAAGILAAYVPFLHSQFLPAHGLTRSAGIMNRIPTRQRWVALAIDDGPTASMRPILADLDRYQAHASFFVVGLSVPGHRAVLAAAVRSGMEIESHTEGHINLSTHSYAQDLRDLKACNRAIEAAVGVRPRWLIPPYGTVNRAARRAARALHLGIVRPTPGAGIPNGSRSVSQIVRQVMGHVEPGAIIVLHDGPGNAAILRALPTILSLLRVEGYRVGSVSQVMAVAAAHRPLR